MLSRVEEGLSFFEQLPGIRPSHLHINKYRELEQINTTTYPDGFLTCIFNIQMTSAHPFFSFYFKINKLTYDNANW